MKIIFIYIKNCFVYLKDFHELYLERLIRLTIYGGALLLPLFFIPLSSQFLEYSKMLLFNALVLIGLVLWIIKIIITKKINWQMQILDIPMILLLIVSLLSSFFSIDRYQSLWGANLIVTTSFVSILFYVLFYFLVSRFITSIKAIEIIFICLISAAFLLFLNSLLNIFSINFLPALLGNSLNTYYFFYLLALILCGLFSLLKGKKIKILFFILSAIFLLVIYIIDNQNILLLLIVNIFSFILISSFRSQYFSNKFVVTLTLLLFFTVLVLILPVGNWLGLITPIEFALPNSFGWQITKTSLSDNLLLGVGPQNFSYSFYKYKPVSFNQTNFWQLGFEKNSNFWLEILNNIGLLGLFIFIIILGKYFNRLLKYVRKFEVFDDSAFKRLFLVIGMGTIIVAIVIFGFLSNFDFLLLYFLFLFLAISASNIQALPVTNIFTNKYVLNLAGYILAIIILCFSYYDVKIITADVFASQVQAKNYSSLEDFNWGENKLEQALKNNPANSTYSLSLINLLINKLTFLQKTDQTADLENLFKVILSKSDLIAKRESSMIVNYLGLQQSYNAIQKLGLPLLEERKKINEKLISLDPNNPELYIDRALLNFDQYSLLKQGRLEVTNKENEMSALLKQIKADLEKSLSKKTNFVLGYFNLGLYYQELGDQVQTLANIEKAYEIDPTQKLVVLSLKKLYLNQDKADKALEILIKYLETNPKDTEVRLELAIVYKDNKDIEQAKAELNKILEIDAENQMAKEILSQLK